MNIGEFLLENFDKKISEYFPSSDWKTKFKKKLPNVGHDEPWLTLITSYSIFGNQKEYSKNRLLAINKVLNLSLIYKTFNFSSIQKVKVEVKLKEIKEYRTFLKKSLLEDNFHLYPDRYKTIESKVSKKSASFEGSTNLDLLIEGVSNGRKATCFVEAKFLSDISYQTKYNPVRDQIIRNIDCGIDYVKSKKHAQSFDDFYFFILTPMIFRIEKFGRNNKSLLTQLGADSSRLYCYKMQEYSDYDVIKKCLPHRQLEDYEWKAIANNIGWIAFEDIYNCCKEFNTFENNDESNMIENFFKERNLIGMK